MNDEAARERLETMMRTETGWAEVARLTGECERLRDEADRERLARRDRDRWLRGVRDALGDVSEDVPNWDGNPIGLAVAVGAKVRRLECDRVDVPDHIHAEGRPWGDGEYIVTIFANGKMPESKPCGHTLSPAEARTVARWLNESWRELCRLIGLEGA